MNIHDVSWSGSSSSGKADNQKKLKNELKNVGNNVPVRKPQSQGLIGQFWKKKSSSNSSQKAYNNQGKRQRKEAEKQRKKAEKKRKKAEKKRKEAEEKRKEAEEKRNGAKKMEDETCKNESSGSASTSNEKSKYFAHPQAKAKKLQEKPDSGQHHQVDSKKSFPAKKSNELDVSDQGSELLYDSWVSLKGSSLHLYIQSQLVRIIVIKKS
jgi:hypothetical protein